MAARADMDVPSSLCGRGVVVHCGRHNLPQQSELDDGQGDMQRAVHHIPLLLLTRHLDSTAHGRRKPAQPQKHLPTHDAGRNHGNHLQGNVLPRYCSVRAANHMLPPSFKQSHVFVERRKHVTGPHEFGSTSISVRTFVLLYVTPWEMYHPRTPMMNPKTPESTGCMPVEVHRILCEEQRSGRVSARAELDLAQPRDEALRGVAVQGACIPSRCLHKSAAPQCLA